MGGRAFNKAIFCQTLEAELLCIADRLGKRAPGAHVTSERMGLTVPHNHPADCPEAAAAEVFANTILERHVKETATIEIISHSVETTSSPSQTSVVVVLTYAPAPAK